MSVPSQEVRLKYDSQATGPSQEGLGTGDLTMKT
jgi:hypothetical protein